MRTSLRMLAPAVVLFAALGLAGCGSDDGGHDAKSTASATQKENKGGSVEEFCAVAEETFSAYENMDPSELTNADGVRKIADDFAKVAAVAPAEYVEEWENIADLMKLTAEYAEDPTSVTQEQLAELQGLATATGALEESLKACP